MPHHRVKMFGLTRWHDHLWTSEMPHRFLGVLRFGARATLVRLDGGELLVHSPIRLDQELKVKVDRLGPVRYLVAPNRFHHLFIGEWAQAYPEADVYLAPGLAEKRSDLDAAGELGSSAHPAWAGVLDQQPIEGAPALSEVVFYHRPSETLISCDLVINFPQPPSLLTGLYLRFAGLRHRAGFSKALKPAYKDRAAARKSFDRILEWQFERLILSHGQVIEVGGREILRDAVAWL